MKCESVACIWSGSPPSHRVTATAVLNHPPTLYTGGSDGSIFWWSVSAAGSTQEIKPSAMLCGHAAAIADLGICCPVGASGNAEAEIPSNVAVNSSSTAYGALISACTDGVLCIWSRSSGHCRRRRKMPPWVGSPSTVRTLPSNQRYACIACFSDVGHLDYQQVGDFFEEDEDSEDKELHCNKPSRCIIVIIDTCTLTIVQTVFCGKLSIGPPKFLTVVSSTEDQKKQYALVVDLIGRGRFLPISKDSYPDEEGGAELQGNYSVLELAAWEDELSKGGHVVSLATQGQIIALIYSTYCIFRSVAENSVIGEINFMDNCLYHECSLSKSHVIGGMFLECHNVATTMDIVESTEMLVGKFAVWNSRGLAIIYRISYLGRLFKFESLVAIPSVSYPHDMCLSLCFNQLSSNLLRVESACFDIGETFLWRPHITSWSLHQGDDNDGELSLQCDMVGEGSLFGDRITSSRYVLEAEGVKHVTLNCAGGLTEIASGGSSVSVVDNHSGISADRKNCSSMQKEQVVSSSMVISGNFYTPHAIVYGYSTGDIEVVQFDMFFQELNSHGGSPPNELGSRVSKQLFLGHTGSVVCLAAHQRLGISKRVGFGHVLLSGSTDCTVRVWDLDTANLIMVMHQHVAPVRQIILPPAEAEHPWSECFLSVGEDFCVALASLETLRVERMFPGHIGYPEKVVWDGARAYVACLCQNQAGSDGTDVLYIWDIKTGALERVSCGTSCHSMFDHFCKGVSMSSSTMFGGNLSVPSLLLPITEDAEFSRSHVKNLANSINSSNMVVGKVNIKEAISSRVQSSGENSFLSFLQKNKRPIKSSCPFPGITTLTFDLASLMSSCKNQELSGSANDKQEKHKLKKRENVAPSPHDIPSDVGSISHKMSLEASGEHQFIKSLELCLLRFSLSFLHLWNIDYELDMLLISEMKLRKPENFIVTSGFPGDRGSLTLTLPGLVASLELWKLSMEFSAMRSLTMVSLAQRMISLSHPSTAASSALAAFYTRHIVEKIPSIKPPSLQLLVSFWQDGSEHVKMVARTLFHCAAARAVPLPLCNNSESDYATYFSHTYEAKENELNNESISENLTKSSNSDAVPGEDRVPQFEESKILAWLESYEVQDWISCVEGTSQDAMASHIIVAAALAIWYPSIVKPSLASVVVHPLTKLVMAMNEKYSSAAAELLAEGMESTWKAHIGSEIPRLIEDIFFQIECVSGTSTNSACQIHAMSINIRETLVEVLLPSLAMADIPGFLTVIESQIWSTASDSPVHIVSLMTLTRVAHASPRNLAQYLDKAVCFILQTMDHGNSVMRRTCLQNSITTLKEVVRVFPMLALNDTSNRLAVGDAIGDINSASIRVYDMQSMIKIKVLDASGPPGLPSLLGRDSDTPVTAAISALSFSPDGEGLVAFSEHGLMIRWWSLGSAWWDKLSRNLSPLQCAKLIFVPPWEGFSPNSSRSSIMASIMGSEKQADFQESMRALSNADSLKLAIQNLDLSYRLEWMGERKVLLRRHGQELGTFLL